MNNFFACKAPLLLIIGKPEHESEILLFRDGCFSGVLARISRTRHRDGEQLMPDKRLEKTRRAYPTPDLVFRSVSQMEAYYTERDREAQAERIRVLLERDAVVKPQLAK